MQFAVRPYLPSEFCAIYRICHLTSPAAADPASNAELHGHVYAGPYIHYEPDLCFVLTGDEEPCGYVLGTRDSTAFAARMDQEWLPPLRKRYPLARSVRRSQRLASARFLSAQWSPTR
jgi:hypothetical protein